LDYRGRNACFDGYDAVVFARAIYIESVATESISKRRHKSCDLVAELLSVVGAVIDY
jgi:hypothetical protein